MCGGNVAFGLRMRGDARSSIEARVAEVLELVGLPAAERGRSTQLSGGEQQRVALARALAPEPRLLMLDEPHGLARPCAARAAARRAARHLSCGWACRSLYVTHDQEEAFSVADRVVVLRDGRIEANGTPEALWSRPPDAWTARFLGFRNVAEADVRAGTADSPWGALPLAGQPDGAVTLVLRPEALSLAADGPLAALSVRAASMATTSA